MKQALPRTSFNSSKLIRSLSGFAPTDVAESKQPIAERLGQWLGVTDAIALFAALNPNTRGSANPPRIGGDLVLAEELARLRTALATSITTSDMTKLALQARIELPRTAPDEAASFTADFFPYRRHYLAQQRSMATSIEALRGKARDALSGLSGKFKQLAALDACLEQTLAVRERDLLAAAPTLLEKRFEQLRDNHQQAASGAPPPDDPDAWMRPGGWLALFCQDFQNVLLAELDLRLQPVSGLIEAHSKRGNEVTTQQ